jgi:hypothetical protein
MKAESIVVIVGRGAELDLAIDAQSESGMAMRRFDTVAEAAQQLPNHAHPRIGAVLLSLMEDAPEALALIEQLRGSPSLCTVPIAVWAPAESTTLVWEAYRRGASSALLLRGNDDDAVWLSRTIHYWKALNEPGRPLLTSAAELAS